MPRGSKIYTRTGDNGTTALAKGRRVPKSSQRIAAYGTVDELNATLGVVLASDVSADLTGPLQAIQRDLFRAGAELCIPGPDRASYAGPQIDADAITALEQLIDRLSSSLTPLRNFILPGGHPAAAQLHVARTVCRRAERAVVALAEHETVGDHVVAYLNRLSDALFVMARYQNHAAGIEEPCWDGRQDSPGDKK